MPVKTVLTFLVFLTVSVVGQLSLLNRLRIVDPNPYFEKVVQETIYDLEERGWCNLKLNDFKQTLNDITHTNMLVTGEVSYFNGFVVSIEKIDVTPMIPAIGSSTVDNVTVTTATVRGNINFHNLKIGFDVLANVTGEERLRRYTGTLTHSNVQGRFHIAKNMNTNVITVSGFANSVAVGNGVRMIYMPADEISAILSLRFSSTTFDNLSLWTSRIIAPLMQEVVRNKVPFPKACFSC